MLDLSNNENFKNVNYSVEPMNITTEWIINIIRQILYLFMHLQQEGIFCH